MFDSHAVESAAVSRTGQPGPATRHETRDPTVRAGLTSLCANGSGSPRRPSGSRTSSTAHSNSNPAAKQP